MLASNTFCHGCTSKILSKQRQRAGLHLCAECDPRVPNRIEVVLRPLIAAAVGFPASIMDDAMLGGASTGCDAGARRPDWGWFARDRAIFLEVDEGGGHPDRLAECEMAKMWDQTHAVRKLLGAEVPVFFVRFNPDAWDGGRAGIDERVDAVAQVVRALLGADASASSPALRGAWGAPEEACLLPQVKYMFYHSACEFQITATRAKPDSFFVAA